MKRPAAIAFFFSALIAVSVAAESLFPTPVHITRQVVDPVSGTTSVIEEYGHGNRLVSIAGSRTSIADYEKGELVEIDRDAATYSVTRFEAIARAGQHSGASAARAAGARTEPQIRSRGVRATRSGHTAEFFEAEIESGAIEIGVDRTRGFSKEAIEVLIGAAWPGVRRPEHDAIFAAAAPEVGAMSGSGSSRGWALPLEQVIRLEVEGQSLELRTSVVRIGSEPPPGELVAIPAGARLVPSRFEAINEVLDEIHRPPPRLP